MSSRRPSVRRRSWKPRALRYQLNMLWRQAPSKPRLTGWRANGVASRTGLQRDIDRHEAAEQSYMDEGVQILELAQNAQRLFAKQQPREKRR